MPRFIKLSSVTTRRHMRAATQGDLNIPRTRTATFGSRVFAVSGPMCWNSPPSALKSSSLHRCAKSPVKDPSAKERSRTIQQSSLEVIQTNHQCYRILQTNDLPYVWCTVYREQEWEFLWTCDGKHRRTAAVVYVSVSWKAWSWVVSGQCRCVVFFYVHCLYRSGPSAPRRRPSRQCYRCRPVCFSSQSSRYVLLILLLLLLLLLLFIIIIIYLP